MHLSNQSSSQRTWRHRSRASSTLLLAAAALASLAGCFGGGDDDTAAPPTAPAPDPLAAVPDAARQSTDGLIGYLQVLGRQPSDTREPIVLDGAALPTSDTAEPAGL